MKTVTIQGEELDREHYDRYDRYGRLYLSIDFEEDGVDVFF